MIFAIRILDFVNVNYFYKTLPLYLAIFQLNQFDLFSMLKCKGLSFLMFHFFIRFRNVRKISG